VVKTALGIGRVVATIIPQYETEEFYTGALTEAERMESRMVSSVFHD